MKDTSFYSNDSYSEYSLEKIPSIDRGSKAAALKTYTTPKELSKILKEKENIVDKSLENQREMLKIEVDLQKNLELNDTTNDPAVNHMISETNQQLQYKLMELETSRKDIVSG